MRRTRLSAPVLFLALGAALAPLAPAAAQEWRPDRGDRSLAFTVPGGSRSALALWWHRSSARAAGLELGLHTNGQLYLGGSNPDEYRLQSRLDVGAVFKRYGEPVGPVSPYLHTGFGVSAVWRNQGIDEPVGESATEWGAGVYGRLGLGVDWFPLERVSLGGFTGGALHYTFLDPADRFGGSTDRAQRHSLAFALFTSGLALHIYF